MQWIILACSAVVSYLLGGVNGAILTSKYFYHKDVRSYGSGNAGLTNFYRVFGTGSAIFVILIDVVKTVIPVLITGILMRPYGLRPTGCAWSAFFVMLGHAYPVYYRFHGGKTVLAGGTALWVMDWRLGLAAWGMFILIVLLTRLVSLGSLLGVATYPIMVAVVGFGDTYTLILAVLSVLLLWFRHRENILRLARGEESRLVIGKNKKSTF